MACWAGAMNRKVLPSIFAIAAPQTTVGFSLLGFEQTSGLASQANGPAKYGSEDTLIIVAQSMCRVTPILSSGNLKVYAMLSSAHIFSRFTNNSIVIGCRLHIPLPNSISTHMHPKTSRDGQDVDPSMSRRMDTKIFADRPFKLGAGACEDSSDSIALRITCTMPRY